MAAETHDAPEAEGRWVQRLLQAGLGLATGLMLFGLVAQLAWGSRHSEPSRLLDVFRGPGPLGEQLMSVGIAVLAFTPVLRVAMLAALWSRERDWRFVVVALVVLATLFAAIALGR